MESSRRARPRGHHEKCLDDRIRYQAFTTTYRQRIHRSRDKDSNLGQMCLFFAIILVMAISCQNKPIDVAEDQQQNGQQAPPALTTTTTSTTPANSQTSEKTSVDSSEKYSLSGWTNVSKFWPRGESAYYVASQKGHHFISTKLPKEVADRKAKVKVSLEFYYHHKNIEPVLSFVSCSNKHDMRSNGNSFEKQKWNVFSHTIDTDDCKQRNDVTVDILLHDGGDILAWKVISLEEITQNSDDNNEVNSEPRMEKRSDDDESNDNPIPTESPIFNDNQNNNDQDQNNQQNHDDNQNNSENKDRGNNQHGNENHEANENQNQSQDNHQTQNHSDSHGDKENKDQNSNQHDHQNNDHDNNSKQPSQLLNLFKIRCEPKECNKKKFEIKRFRPLVNGLPMVENSLMKDSTYLINDRDRPLRIKLVTKENLATRDLCLDANFYMDEGTKLLLMYPHSTKEHSKSSDTSAEASSEQQKEDGGNVANTDAEAENDKQEPQPTAGKFESSPSKDNDNSSPATQMLASAANQANQISTQATQETSTNQKNQVEIKLITEITPPKTPKPQWTRRKICVSDHLPRLEFGDESTDKELLLLPKVGPNDIIGIQFHPESGVAFTKQLTSLPFMPNLNHISNDNVQEYWKANGGDLVVYDPSVGTGTGAVGDQLRSHNKQLNISNIMSGQDSFDLVSRWLKLSNDQAKKVKFNLRTKNETWIQGVDIGYQRAGGNWSTTSVYPPKEDLNKKGYLTTEEDPNTKKDEIALPILLEDVSDEEFRVKIIYNLTDEAKKSNDKKSLTITSLAIGDPCIDKDYCQNNGVCKAIGTSQAQCECPQGYSGEKCEHVNPCEVLYDGRSGKFICESINAKCMEKIPVLRCLWPNDEYLECKVKEWNNNLPDEGALQDGKELTSDQMKLKIAEQSKLIIIMGALMAALSLFAIVIIGNLVMRLLASKKRVKSAEEAREMSSRLGDRHTTGVPKYGRPAAASFQNQAFDD